MFLIVNVVVAHHRGLLLAARRGQNEAVTVPVVLGQCLEPVPKVPVVCSHVAHDNHHIYRTQGLNILVVHFDLERLGSEDPVQEHCHAMEASELPAQYAVNMKLSTDLFAFLSPLNLSILPSR